MPNDVVTISFKDENSNTIAAMDLAAGPESRGIQLLPETEAGESGGACAALDEGTTYEYQLRKPGFHLREEPGLISSSIIPSECDRGRIATGLNTGRLRLVLTDESNEEVGDAYVEIRPVKMTYQVEYRIMLEFIAERCTDLLLEFRSPVEQTLMPDDSRKPDTRCQQFAFVRYLVTSRRFRDAIQRVLALPHRLWDQEEHEIPIYCGFKPSASVSRQLASSARRMSLLSSHNLASRLPSIPERVKVQHNAETLDTAENRFVKYVLRTLQSYATEVKELLVERKQNWHYTRTIEEAAALEEELGEILGRDFFRNISEPEILPLGSPVLQRKSGYSEILTAWLRFDMAARLHWLGGEDVYGAGKRNIATLYEYWLFFKLVDLVSDIFHLDQPAARSLIEETEDGFGLKLKSGRYIPLEGVYDPGYLSRKIRIRFSYNRTFRHSGPDEQPNYPAAGSWSRAMRPDYTLSLWPVDYEENEAEEQELMTHLHFDAKYRVETIQEIFGHVDEDLTAEKAAQKEGRYRRADLLKMHAYRDAIRRTAGAYVLYPGAQNCGWQGFHEIVPGLGAFAIRPTDDSQDCTSHLRQFILQVVNHICDRASQLDRYAFHRYSDHAEIPVPRMVARLPERFYCSGRRHMPVDDTVALIGFIRSAACEICRELGIFYYHALDPRGQPISFDPGLLKAHYFVPYSDHSNWVGWFAPIERCGLISCMDLEAIIGAGILVHKAPFYYLVSLERNAVAEFEKLPTAPSPKPGSPSICSWADLYASPPGNALSD